MIIVVCVHVIDLLIDLCVCLLALIASERALHINMNMYIRGTHICRYIRGTHNMNMYIRGTHICRKQAHTSQWDLVSLFSCLCLPPLLHPLSFSSASCFPLLLHAVSSSFLDTHI